MVPVSPRDQRLPGHPKQPSKEGTRSGKEGQAKAWTEPWQLQILSAPPLRLPSQG